MLASPCGSLFHTTLWLGASGSDFAIYGVFDGEELCGGFVAPYRRDARTARVSLRPALTPYSGLVVFQRPGKPSSAITRGKALAACSAAALKGDFARINFRLSPHIHDVQEYIWAGFAVSVRYTYIVDISTPEAAWSNLDENHRRSIRRAEKEGIEVESNLHPVDCMGLFRATRDSPSDWQNLMQDYEAELRPRGFSRTFVARDPSGEAAAAVYLVWDRFRSYYLLGGYRSNCADRSLTTMATTAAIWEAMRYSRDELNLKHFDLEGSMIPGVELFFRKFGGVLTPFYVISWARPATLLRSTVERTVRAIGRMVAPSKGNSQ